MNAVYNIEFCWENIRDGRNKFSPRGSISESNLKPAPPPGPFELRGARGRAPDRQAPESSLPVSTECEEDKTTQTPLPAPGAAGCSVLQV